MTQPTIAHPAHVRAAALLREAMKLLQVDPTAPTDILAAELLIRLQEACT